MPAGPATLTRQPRPDIASSIIASSELSSQTRPTNAGSSRVWRALLAVPMSCLAGKGISDPLIDTDSGVPSSVFASTSRAVASLSITSPGRAAASIRCAMPT